MQRYDTRSSSNTPLLIAALGIGATLAYALSSPRRRAMLAAAGQSALEAGSRLASTSADRLQELPRQALDAVSDLTQTARSASARATSATADTLHDAIDRASDRMHDVLSRAHKRPDDERRRAREQVREALQYADNVVSTSRYGRSTGRTVMMAAVGLGAGLYAVQRYGGSARVMEKLGADESGTITSEKTIFINAPVEQVFDAWASYENFPRFMSNVKTVQPLGGDRSHWKVRGPAGVGVEFDSVAQMQRPNEINWHSEPGSAVRNEGRVTLVPEGGGTRATVRMSYQPPAGALGRGVSSLLGADPKRLLEDDLNRMKQFIEGQRLRTPEPV
jgi:uncharacterized membrane protein